MIGTAQCLKKHKWTVKLVPYTFGLRGTPAACPKCGDHYTTLYDTNGLRVNGETACKPRGLA